MILLSEMYAANLFRIRFFKNSGLKTIREIDITDTRANLGNYTNTGCWSLAERGHLKLGNWFWAQPT
jgi:hypothetical protein